MADLARRHGAPLMYLRLGEVHHVVASSPAAAREVLRAQEANFPSRPASPSARAMMADGGAAAGLASAPYGAHWRQLRRIYITELLSARRVRSFRLVREEEAARLLAAAAAAAARGRGEAVNVSASAAALVTDATLADLFPSSRLAGLVSSAARRAEAVHLRMSELMDCAIRRHQERRRSAVEGDDEENILDVLLRIHNEGCYEIPLTMGGIKDMILDLFLAGTETLTATLEWAISELVRNPRTLQKAQAELRDELQGRPAVTEDDLPGLSYLKLVIKETLRLHPAAPMLARECAGPCKVLGYDVPRGATVLVNAWAIGRDPEHWGGDAEAFRPERFENGGGGGVDFRGMDYEFIPFGAGRRMCPGMAFAQALVELALAAMLYHFDWELPAGVAPGDLDMEEDTGVVVGRKNDLYLRAVVRVPPPDSACGSAMQPAD